LQFLLSLLYPRHFSALAVAILSQLSRLPGR